MDSIDTYTPNKPCLLCQVCAASIPTVAVLIGLYVFSNGWITIALYYTAVPFYIAATRQIATFGDLTRGFDIRLAFIAALICALAGPAAYLCLLLASRTGITMAGFLGSIGLGGWRYILLGMVFCTVNPVVEETFWRGTFRPDHRKPHWSDLAFALFHIFVIIRVATLPVAILCFLVLALTGWFLRYLTYRTNGLAAPYFAHLAGDISITMAIWFFSGV